MLTVTVHLTGGPRRNCSAAIAVGHKLYSFGYLRFGETFPAWDQIFVHIFNTVSLLWMKLPPVTNERGERPPEVPSQCAGHTAVLIEDIAYIWGGTDKDITEYYNVLYAFDVDTHRWFRPKVSGVVPEGRHFHSACVLGKVMYVYGGHKMVNGFSFRQTIELFMLDTTTMVWSLIKIRGTPPPASWCHSAAIIGTKMFVCASLAALPDLDKVQKDDYRTISEFDTETNCWLRSSHHLPLDVSYHSAFAYNGELYIIEAPMDVWKFNPETSLKKLEPKGKRLHSDSGCHCCMVGDRIVVYGGSERNLFILDLSPSMKTLCKLAVARYDLDQSQLPHDIRWELAAMTTEKIT